jgi:hypothetical protein
MSEQLDRIASAIRSAETLNAIHACRDGHPLGRDNSRKWRNAHFMVMGRPALERMEIDHADLDWLERQATKEMLANA